MRKRPRRFSHRGLGGAERRGSHAPPSIPPNGGKQGERRGTPGPAVQIARSLARWHGSRPGSPGVAPLALFRPPRGGPAPALLERLRNIGDRIEHSGKRGRVILQRFQDAAGVAGGGGGRYVDYGMLSGSGLTQQQNQHLPLSFASGERAQGGSIVLLLHGGFVHPYRLGTDAAEIGEQLPPARTVAEVLQPLETSSKTLAKATHSRLTKSGLLRHIANACTFG